MYKKDNMTKLNKTLKCMQKHKIAKFWQEYLVLKTTLKHKIQNCAANERKNCMIKMTKKNTNNDLR